MTSEHSHEPETASVRAVEPESYTALRLQHASAEHIHLTTRRSFIGPIPEGWLKSHRKSWYKKYLGSSSYSSKVVTFSARKSLSYHRQITGLDGPSASASIGQSFPQPEDVGDEQSEQPDVTEGEQYLGATERADAVINELEAQPTTGEDRVDASASPEEQDVSRRKQRQRRKNKSLFVSEDISTQPSASSFVTAPTRPWKTFKSRLTSTSSAKSARASSFVTAKESPTPRKDVTNDRQGESVETAQNARRAADEYAITPRSTVQSTSRIAIHEGTDSTSRLLPPNRAGPSTATSPDILAKDTERNVESVPSGLTTSKTGLVRFNLSNKHNKSDFRSAAKIGEVGRQRIWKRLVRGQSHPGEIVKMERMLVRVDSTMQKLPEDYDENDSLKTEARTVEKWREYIVVCRESANDDAQFLIQMYKTRVIPAKEQTHVQKRSTHEIPLAHKTTHVNLYSSLDKTLVLWLPWKVGTMMFILRTRSAASAIEWYTFIRHSLGWQRPTDLHVNVPDLSVTLQLENPFGELEASMNADHSGKAADTVISRAMEVEKAIASTVIQRSLKILENNQEWADVLEAWLEKEKIGLAWKRYDRLEWVHGANEQRMFGTMAMQRTHELELRPKDHYPTEVRTPQESMMEPAPVEGFLVRLTSQKGHIRRMGKMYFKRLYFATHDQFLCYCRPAKALPPPPPKLSLTNNARVPSASEIVEKTPLIFAVNPFPNEHGEIGWFRKGTPSTQQKHDEDAYKESERKTSTLLNTEGYINLSHVVRVQNIKRGNSPADANMDQGPDVDFHQEVEDTTRDDGTTDQFDDNRTFELVLKNKLVIRLQAYNTETKKEWVHSLRKLVQYWKLRLAEDMSIYKTVRGLNLKRLEIDEEMEAHLGQFGRKWEVTRSIASPKLFNMCGISCCRAITMSGVLYHKPRRHTTFLRCGVILSHGQLLIFHSTLREKTGKEVRHIQHERQNTIDLKNCYIYSGLVTEGDLLYQNQTFDSNHPGHHALPRVYLEDGWTSTDEDTMTCFVIWQPRNKSLFKANEEKDLGGTRQRLRYVSTLGVPGRSIVFKTRSRAERDHWVMSIGMEIDRLQAGEDVRIVDKK